MLKKAIKDEESNIYNVKPNMKSRKPQKGRHQAKTEKINGRC